jgi:hypothetical protein
MPPYRDVTVASDTKYLRYAHYHRDGQHCYLFSNESMTVSHATVTVRGFSGGYYTVWDAFENQAVSAYSADGVIRLTIHPNNLIVLFTDTELTAEHGKFLEDPDPSVCEAEAEWSVELCAEAQLPNYLPYKTFPSLKNITAPDEMPNFTGNIRYTACLTLDPSLHRVLDLGAVGQTAEVRINGIHVGTRIFAPYRFDISKAIRKGENRIEITVTNTCVHSQRDPLSRFMLIKPSGLLGPVKFYS